MSYPSIVEVDSNTFICASLFFRQKLLWIRFRMNILVYLLFNALMGRKSLL